MNVAGWDQNLRLKHTIKLTHDTMITKSCIQTFKYATNSILYHKSINENIEYYIAHEVILDSYKTYKNTILYNNVTYSNFTMFYTNYINYIIL